MVMASSPPPTSQSSGFLSRDEWFTFGGFLLLLGGLSLVDRRLAVYVGVGAIVIIVVQHWG